METPFAARDTQLQRDVALKLLPEHLTNDSERIALFQREARVLASLNHPNVAQIYGLEQMGGASCIVMELVEGETPVRDLASLSPLIVAGSVRWIVFGPFSRLERTFAYLLSAGAAAVTLSGYFFKFDWPTGAQEWLSWVIPLATLGLAAYFLIRNRRAEASTDFNPVMAMQMAYIANGVLCLVALFGEWQVGAYCVLVAASSSSFRSP